MATRNLFLLLFAITSLLSSCSKKIYPDRSQFLKDGDPVPTVRLDYYKSVQQRPGQDSSLAVALAISGGGSRAANFGMGIMLGLEALQLGQGQNMLNQVDYISTVSGGGFAGGAYVAALYEHQYFQRQEPFLLKDYLKRQIRDDLSLSYTGVLLSANINPRLWFSYVDDGDALERAIDEHVLGFGRRRKREGSRTRSLMLRDLFVPAGSTGPVRFPMHITNSSTVNTMTIFPFTPDILERYQINGYTHRLRTIKRDSLDPFTVPLAVGIKASGSFPVLISNTTLRSTYDSERPFLHLIDGAMTENIGYYTALEILKQERSRRHKVLLVVDADAAGNRFTFSKREAALFSLSVLGRLPSSGLDARRATLVNDIRAVCRQYGITPIFFSFNILLHDNNAPIPESIEPKTEQKRLIAMLNKQDTLSDSDRQVLYELLTHIGTKYTITDDEQELLLLSGQLIVRMQEEELRRAMIMEGTGK
ncbi:MAG: patatin-like phospholipase family protein [Phaeodactylibacter sp.]|nr:patatin-like phospholipase family protein [Phaeodactylibacter sp.]MCB9272455.1 patatin-like phospholipase family protein [Lewinellaceae bacterium]